MIEQKARIENGYLERFSTGLDEWVRVQCPFGGNRQCGMSCALFVCMRQHEDTYEGSNYGERPSDPSLSPSKKGNYIRQTCAPGAVPIQIE